MSILDGIHDYSLPGGNHDHAYLPSRRRKFNYVAVFMLLVVMWLLFKPAGEETSTKPASGTTPAVATAPAQSPAGQSAADTTTPVRPPAGQPATDTPAPAQLPAGQPATDTPAPAQLPAGQPAATPGSSVDANNVAGASTISDDYFQIILDFYLKEYDQTLVVEDGCSGCETAIKELEKKTKTNTINLSQMKDGSALKEYLSRKYKLNALPFKLPKVEPVPVVIPSSS